ncbi:MAG: B12-binding domain-containing radical SAM protein, partial [Acetanaerobacterium sp.]
FEFEPQDTREQIERKQSLLRQTVKSRKISLSWHGVNTSILEAAFARGDRRLGAVIEEAYRRGCIFDGWEECFRFDTWMQVMQDLDIDPAFYANRQRAYDEIMPWDHLDYYITKEFLVREHQTALQNKTTPNCRQACANCGAMRAGGGVCHECHEEC